MDAARKIERDPAPGLGLEGWVRDAGFVNVKHEKFRFPLGQWPKDAHMKTIGQYNLAQVMAGLEAFSLRLFCHVLGWQKEEVLVLISKVRKELRDPNLHAQFDL